MDATSPRRLKAVTPADAPYTLHLVWTTGEAETVDLTGVIHRAMVFAPLQDPNLFRQVEVINWGDGIAWPNGLDYGSDSLERLSELQSVMGSEDFAQWQKDLGLSNQEAADLLGVSLNSIKNYRKENKIPRAVQIACTVLRHDRVAVDALYRPRKAGRPPTADKSKAPKRVKGAAIRAGLHIAESRTTKMPPNTIVEKARFKLLATTGQIAGAGNDGKPRVAKRAQNVKRSKGKKEA
ncbi:MAG: DUF2442 domain-containing protein [Hyphomicrobiales bacterium]|nr:DUF2442 domain-containing protein [Hyphomicrobiales bacterium]MCP5371968.1 DUF2442 domain-containing protein [Hyphomicrobiales bacterium]